MVVVVVVLVVLRFPLSSVLSVVVVVVVVVVVLMVLCFPLSSVLSQNYLCAWMSTINTVSVSSGKFTNYKCSLVFTGEIVLA